MKYRDLEKRLADIMAGPVSYTKQRLVKALMVVFDGEEAVVVGPDDEAFTAVVYRHGRRAFTAKADGCSIVVESANRHVIYPKSGRYVDRREAIDDTDADFRRCDRQYAASRISPDDPFRLVWGSIEGTNTLCKMKDLVSGRNRMRGELAEAPIPYSVAAYLDKLKGMAAPYSKMYDRNAFLKEASSFKSKVDSLMAESMSSLSARYEKACQDVASFLEKRRSVRIFR